jgi:methylmalonyl-CoA mutase C-terminal domain/subunit
MEVIYTGLHQTADMIVEAAIQEDVDVVGLSLLSGAHMTLFVDVAKLFKKNGIGNILILGGGIIPEEDVPKLKKEGVSAIFGPGTPCEDIVNFIRKNVKR